jgi:serine protease Do
MSVLFCGRCGTARVAPDDVYCRACGKAYSSVKYGSESTLLTDESAGPPASEGRDALSQPSQSRLPTKWLDFWIYVHLPAEVFLGVPISLFAARTDDEALFGTIIIDALLVWAAVVTWLGLRKRRMAAWQLNWLFIVLDIIGFTNSRISESASGDKATTFIVSFFAYTLFWGLPNYIYFKKRRVLFSGPPLIDGGILGFFKTVGRFIWPPILDRETARKASREGFYAVSIIFVLQVILMAFSAFGHTLFRLTISGWWSDAALFAVIGWGIYRISRTAVLLGIILFLSERFVPWVNYPDTITLSNVLVQMPLLLMLINGVRGAFAYHQYQTTVTISEASAPKSAYHWQIYSFVLASFVLGAIALRAYQSFRSTRTSATISASSEELPALLKRVRPAVVTITTYDSRGNNTGQGSGFFVSKAGELLTNHHVLAGANTAEIKMSDGTTHPIAAILADDPDSDLTKAIVILDDDTAFLPLARQRAETGERIVVVGSPLGLEETVSEGIVSAVPEDREEVGDIMAATLQITAAISEGSSGGPVMNQNGEVVGVAAAYLQKGQQLNFAIPLEAILTLKRRHPITLAMWSDPHRKPDQYSYFSEGLTYMQLTDCEDGLRSFALSLKKNPNFAWAWWGAGVCFMQKDAPEKAIAALKEAIELDPSLGPPHYALGLAYLAQNRRGPAREEYEALKNINSDLAKKLATQLGQ